MNGELFEFKKISTNYYLLSYFNNSTCKFEIMLIKGDEINISVKTEDNRISCMLPIKMTFNMETNIAENIEPIIVNNLDEYVQFMVGLETGFKIRQNEEKDLNSFCHPVHKENDNG